MIHPIESVKLNQQGASLTQNQGTGVGEGKVLKEVERSTIKYLEKKEGVSITEIARLTGHTRKTVRRVLQEPTDKEYQRGNMESKVDKFYEEDPVVRFATLPGEQLQIDWGEAVIDYDEDEKVTEYFFTARMKHSRYMYVEVRDNMKLETLINCILHAFEDLGGVPLSLVFDNMKTVVTKIDKQDDPVWNETFFKFATELDFHPIACTPNQPNQKGSVENLVKYVKNFLHVTSNC